MLLRQGDSGTQVTDLQKALAVRGFDSGGTDGTFGPATRNAVITFQQSVGLDPDGVAGTQTLQALGVEEVPAASSTAAASRIPAVTVEMVCRIVAGTPRSHVETHLPHVLNALYEPQLSD